MRFLGIFSLLGGFLVLLFVWRTFFQFYKFHQKALKNKAFKIRRASMSIPEWQRWNKEFFSFNVFKVPILFAVAEGLLLTLALKQHALLTGLLIFVLLLQMIPLFFYYVIHLALLFRYGRFNFERFDKEHQTLQSIMSLFFVLCAWLPVLGTWFYFSFFPISG